MQGEVDGIACVGEGSYGHSGVGDESPSLALACGRVDRIKDLRPGRFPFRKLQHAS